FSGCLRLRLRDRLRGLRLGDVRRVERLEDALLGEVGLLLHVHLRDRLERGGEKRETASRGVAAGGSAGGRRLLRAEGLRSLSGLERRLALEAIGVGDRAQVLEAVVVRVVAQRRRRRRQRPVGTVTI